MTHANYNGMTVNLRRTFGNMHGWGSSFFPSGYTRSHELDNVTGFRQRTRNVPYYDPNDFYASGDTADRNAQVLSGGWELPFDHLWQSGPARRSPRGGAPVSDRDLAYRISFGRSLQDSRPLPAIRDPPAQATQGLSVPT